MESKATKVRLMAIIGALVLALCAPPALANIAEDDGEAGSAGASDAQETPELQVREIDPQESQPQVKAGARKHFDLTTRKDRSRPGYAITEGDLTYLNRRQFTIVGRVNDKCPPNEHGAYVRVLIRFAGGGSEPAFIAKDVDTCDEPANRFSKKVTVRGARIASVRVVLYERDDETNSRDAITYGRFKDNPFVGR